MDGVEDRDDDLAQSRSTLDECRPLSEEATQAGLDLESEGGKRNHTPPDQPLYTWALDGACVAVLRRKYYMVGNSGSSRPVEYAFFCPSCCRIWASIGARDGKSLYQSISRQCETCGNQSGHAPSVFTVGGSLWLSWDHEFLEEMPRELKKREFDLHYEQWNRMRYDRRV